MNNTTTTTIVKNDNLSLLNKQKTDLKDSINNASKQLEETVTDVTVLTLKIKEEKAKIKSLKYQKELLEKRLKNLEKSKKSKSETKKSDKNKIIYCCNLNSGKYYIFITPKRNRITCFTRKNKSNGQRYKINN